MLCRVKVSPLMTSSAEADLLVLLTDLARLIRKLADRRARAHGMTRAQWIILARLRRRPGLIQNELAEILEVEPITVGRLVDRLEARGLVERRPDPADRRVRRLHLTPAAAPVLGEIDEARTAFDAAATQGLTGDDRAALLGVLSRLKSNLQRLDAADDAAGAAA
jgi:DNA-binding MarR family transcriptional regulator